MSATRTPLDACRRCFHPVDAATAIAAAKKAPGAGDVSICWYCGTVSIYNADQTLRSPTKDELTEIAADDGVVAFLNQIWAKRGLQTEKRTDWPCGCVTDRSGQKGSAGLLKVCSKDCIVPYVMKPIYERAGIGVVKGIDLGRRR